MRGIGIVLALVGAAIAAFLLTRASAPARRSAGTQGSRGAAESLAPREPAAAEGVVVDAETDAPVARARVTLYRLPLDSPEAPLVATYVTDDAGRFSVPLPQPDDATLLVIEADGYPPQADWFDREGPGIRLGRGTERTLVIVDDEGRPAAGAEVGVYAEWRLPLAVVEADAHGIATVRIGQGTSILVRFPGHAYEERQRDDALFILSPGFSIGGKVIDAAKSPISGAYVHLRQGGGGCKDDSEYAPSARTGPDGRFLFRGIHGCTCELTVRAEGYRERVARAVPGDEETRVVLQRPGAATGTVVLPDGSPAAGARVHARLSDEDWETAQADGEGRFSIDGLDPRPQRIEAFAAPDLVGSAEVEVPAGKAAEGVRIVLRPRDRSYVRLRVLDERGRPVPGVKVIRHFWWADAVTDEEGAAIAPLDDPEIDVKLHLVPDDKRTPLLCESEIVTKSTSSPEGTPVQVVLRESVLVRLEAGGPEGERLSEADASFDGGHADEDDEGQGYRLDPAATYRIRVSAPGHLDTVIEGWTFLAQGPAILAGPRPCATVKGRAVDASGAPVAALMVAFDGALAMHDGMRKDLTCDPDGTFLVEGLAEGGGRLVFSRKEQGVPEASVVVATRSGKVTDVGTLRLEAPIAVTGRVVDSAGRPLGGARIGMVGIPEHWDVTYSHADGAFRAKVPAFPGDDLVVRKRGFGTVRVTVRPGMPTALGDIALPACGALEVEAEGIDWKRVDFVTIDVAWPGGPLVETAPCLWEHELRPYRFDDLAPGRYAVRLSFGDVTLQDEIEVAAGETTRVTFRLR